jgi:uncharacterized membrane protein YfcA
MTLHDALILFPAGIGGGAMASIVGGASIVTFPVLLTTGLSPVVATASNLIAVSPGNVVAAFADRRRLPPFDRAFLGLVGASVGGALLGAILLVVTPMRTFEVLIPVLLGFATLLFAFARQLTEWFRARVRARSGRDPHLSVTSIPMLLPVSVYGGYFGAGAGVLLLGVLSIATGGEYRSANVVKNLVSALNSAAAAVCFIGSGNVSWPHTLTMMSGCLIGGFCGVHLSRRIPQEVMRVVVVIISGVLTVVFAWRYWF